MIVEPILNRMYPSVSKKQIHFFSQDRTVENGGGYFMTPIGGLNGPARGFEQCVGEFSCGFMAKLAYT